MNAADDPYFNWLEMMRREGAAAVDAPYLIGTVLSVSPLKVQVGELEIERKRLKINSFLLTGYTRRWNLALTDAIGQPSGRGTLRGLFRSCARTRDHRRSGRDIHHAGRFLCGG